MCKWIFCVVLLVLVSWAYPLQADEVGVKTFIPGMVQRQNKEMIKFYGIVGGEAITLIAGAVSWYCSESEYDKYKNLPRGSSQDKFDKHYNASNFYGTVSIGSFAGFSAIYLYSVIDAIWFSYGKEVEEQGFYLVPKKDGVVLSAVIKF